MTSGSTQLERTAVVLHEPQDLVNIALVIRAMKNMGLRRLRLVRPGEWDTWRIQGIAHDTRDIVERVEIFDELPDALADARYVLGATARRRSTRQEWWTPEGAAGALVDRGDETALLFGREDAGLPNEALDFCHGLVRIPTNPDHPSLNLAHAVLIVLYELRKAAAPAEDDALPFDISFKRRRQSPPATHGEMEDFFETWETAMTELGLFHGIDPLPKMRSFRALFQRAELDRRELGLIQATAYEIIHFVARERARVANRMETADEAGEEAAEEAGEAAEEAGSGPRASSPRAGVEGRGEPGS